MINLINKSLKTSLFLLLSHCAYAADLPPAYEEPPPPPYIEPVPNNFVVLSAPPIISIQPSLPLPVPPPPLALSIQRSSPAVLLQPQVNIIANETPSPRSRARSAYETKVIEKHKEKLQAVRSGKYPYPTSIKTSKKQ